MSFNLSEWWMRQRIGAQVQAGGTRVEHRRIGNPYHAVSIDTGARCCEAARDIERQRFLSTEAPMLPLEGCTRSSCQCRYAHHDDRRITRDRRVNFANPHARSRADRRASSGRRLTD